MANDLTKLQGTWHVVEMEMEGHSGPVGNEARIVVEGDRFTSLGMGASYEGKLTVNATSKPKGFDLKFTSGPEKGNTNLGIYELKGNRWKICLDTRGKGRPEKFAAQPGSGRAVEILERAPASARPTPKGKAAAEPENLPANPAPELEGEWTMLSGAQSGQPMPKDWHKFAKRTATGNRITVTMNGQVMLDVRFTVNRESDPKAIDYVVAAGPAIGKRQYGIYRLDGETLTTAIAALGDPRPADFRTQTGDGRLVTSWRRVK
jgi:uncharacterized protein (TIGR03067 family)